MKKAVTVRIIQFLPGTNREIGTLGDYHVGCVDVEAARDRLRAQPGMHGPDTRVDLIGYLDEADIKELGLKEDEIKDVPKKKQAKPAAEVPNDGEVKGDGNG